MTWIRKNPVFATLLFVCAFLVLAALGLIYERWATGRALAKKLEERRSELADFKNREPAPTRDVAKVIEADLAKAEQTLAAMQAELKGRGPLAEKLRTTKAPASRTDSYFDLAQYVERMRAAARKNEVSIGAEAARFGFAAHANQGPENEELIEPVFRQRQITQYLLEALFEGRPAALLEVKREPPVSQKEKEERAAALAAAQTEGAEATEAPAETEPAALPEGPDFFELDRRATARVPGFVDGIGFRLVFTGQTAALRTFLNKLGTFELPVLVREVQVDPATAEDTASLADEAAAPTEQPAVETPAASVVLDAEVQQPPAPKAPARKSASRTATTPIVAKTFSKFTVVLEYVELVTPPAANPEEPANPATI